MTDRRGGRIPPDGRPSQAKGVGKNAKRHDLERPKTPGLHGSDLQQGDVQAMEQGQRIAPAQTQERGQTQIAAQTRERGPGGMETSSMVVPDPIDFITGRESGTLGTPTTGRAIENHRALNWLPLLQQLVVGPGSSSMLASAFINQMRQLGKISATPAAIIDLGAIDEGIDAMLDEDGN